MNIVFIGSQPIGHDCLNEIIKLGVDVKAIFTFKPDKHEKWEKSVIQIANEKKIPLFYSEDLTTKKIQELNPELIVVIGYRKIFPQEILEIPKHGIIGIHASLLPHLRGQAPLNWSIILGDNKTGATLFKMDKGIDTGDIIGQREISIKIENSIEEIKKEVRKISVELISENILKIFSGTCKMIKQSKNGTYGSARIPEDGKINWNQDTLKIYNLIRALEKTYPAFTFLDSKKLYILKSEIINGGGIYYGTPGQVAMTSRDGSVIIITGNGFLKIITVKLDNEDENVARTYLKSSKIRLE